MTRQYEFRDGHFVDTWNDGYDDTCDPADHGEESWPEMLLETICGCGDPGLVVATMAAYLQRVETGSDAQVRFATPDYVADYLIACMADDHHFTEHGGAIGGSWLTDAGKRWLELWRVGANVEA